MRMSRVLIETEHKNATNDSIFADRFTYSFTKLFMLKDLKVLELASVLAGPSVGQFFAELGAEVIKVENLKTGGDVTRTWRSSGELTDDRSAYFCSVNWGKKSVAVDLTTPEGKSTVQKLAVKSDVIIASYKPGDAEKLGVSYDQLKINNPKLIYGQITGYGSDNERVGYDAVIQAESGFMDLNGEKNGLPTKMPVALIDVLAGHQLKEALLVALLKRERSGEGTFTEVSLLDTAISSLTNQATNWLVANKLPSRQGSLHPNIAPYGESFETKDGKRILLAVGSDRQFFDLLRILKIDPLIFENKFSTNHRRIENREEMNGVLAKAISGLTASELFLQIHKLKIPAGIIQNVREVFEMQAAKDLLMYADSLRGVRTFVAKGKTDKSVQLLPPPHFGEHTEAVLQSL
jgi:crotonobetainyl-CoA:carnitine CoA-transferase CaiB-like acyl-CoA transferase